ncbi:MAG: hypothetical protein H6883_07050 [Rhodobiaceae bacterium]|nr:hypothetical protein [Rhodobiaceae bacterium]MCC0055877.1 hypothetical protein [Rhodobiaceae bacterium]
MTTQFPWRLTGRWRPRTGLFGPVCMVEEARRISVNARKETRWRKARNADIEELEKRPIHVR